MHIKPNTSPREDQRRARYASYHLPNSCGFQDSALRANPCPEVTDPFCRLPLPTLFYQLEAVHLGDLLRLLVRSISNPAFPCFFTACQKLSRRRTCRRSYIAMPFRQLICFHAMPRCYKEKTSLPGAFANVCRFSCVAACPEIRAGILTSFPF